MFEDRMKPIIRYIKGYFYESDKRVLAIVSILTGILIWSNYHFGIDKWISNHNSFVFSFFSRAIIFTIAFGLPYLITTLVAGKKIFRSAASILLLIIAPLIFSFKIALNPQFGVAGNWDTVNFWNHVLYWPALMLVTVFILFIIWIAFDSAQPFYGLKTKGMDWKPYLIMLLIMLPLVAAASTQADFLAMYPKLRLIADVSTIDRLSWWQKLLFELSYGSDFITIELFFRGFLVLAFLKWAGRDAILPMACFYCTIHFGKPLGECISSYFGGMILGIVVYHTRSAIGGLIVHLGIAWMMEIGGYIGNAQ